NNSDIDGVPPRELDGEDIAEVVVVGEQRLRNRDSIRLRVHREHAVGREGERLAVQKSLSEGHKEPRSLFQTEVVLRQLSDRHLVIPHTSMKPLGFSLANPGLHDAVLMRTEPDVRRLRALALFT